MTPPIWMQVDSMPLDATLRTWRDSMVAIRNLERAGNSERAGRMTANEAADQLGVKLGTLYAYVSRGWLKSYRRKVGRQALYRRADIEALRGVVSTERGRRARSLPEASP